MEAQAHPHLHIQALGLGYYAVHTRADVYGESLPIHEMEVPKWGTLYGRCQALLAEQSMTPDPQRLAAGRKAAAARAGKVAARMVAQGLDWNAGYYARLAARWALAATSGNPAPLSGEAVSAAELSRAC